MGGGGVEGGTKWRKYMQTCMLSCFPPPLHYNEGSDQQHIIRGNMLMGRDTGLLYEIVVIKSQEIIAKS